MIKRVGPLLAKLGSILVVLFVAAILAVTVRGIPGNPTSNELNNPQWKDEGPFELSPDRGRFALTYSLIEDRSFQFSIDLARFAAPDVAYSDGKFSSLFAPALSYMIIPGYLIGKMLGASQVGAFAMISVFAFLNVLLIRAIAQKLGAHPAAASVSGLLYLFASPAFAYAVTIYQHHVSAFFILVSLYVFLHFKHVLALTIIWFLCALSISLDNPNLFLMMPLGIAALTRLIYFEKRDKNLTLTIKPLGFLTMSIMALPLAFFMYFNQMSYGNPLQLGGTVSSAAVVNLEGNVDIADLDKRRQAQDPTLASKDEYKKSAVKFFNPRRLPSGFYTLVFSRDRGIIMFTPILVVGAFGLILLTKTQPQAAQLILAIVGINFLLYSMWGDPYGGWAFGSRYLIPSYALLSILLSMILTRFRKNIFLLLLVLVLSIYAIGVNTIGALTSNRNPPYIQILELESITGQRERYTYTRNMEMLDGNGSKSFFFRQIGEQYLTAWQYMQVLTAAISTVVALHLFVLYCVKHDRQN